MGAGNESNIGMLYEQLMKRFVGWAETRVDIRAAVVVGSRARTDRAADEWADLDVLVITTEPKLLLSITDWLEEIGSPLLTFLEPTSTGEEMERRVLFEGMLDVDFAVIPKSKADQILQMGVSPELSTQLSNIFGRGMSVLLDKDGISAQLQTLLSTIHTPTPQPPTRHEFLEVISNFLYHAVFTAKHLRRGELWWTKMSSDCHMQHLLLRMIEWHARALHGWNYDTWFRGRFLEEWAHPDVVERLHETFARYDQDDAGRALLASLDLFRWIGMETARRLNYPYPTEADKRVTEWTRACLSKKDEHMS